MHRSLFFASGLWRETHLILRAATARALLTHTTQPPGFPRSRMILPEPARTSPSPTSTSQTRPLHAAGSDRLRRRHEHVCLCEGRSVNFADPAGLQGGPVFPITAPYTYRQGGISAGAQMYLDRISREGMSGPGTLGHGNEQRPQPNRPAPKARVGHSYRRDARICTAGRGKKCDIARTNSEACVLPGHISGRPVQSGDLYTVYAGYADIIPSGIVRTTRTGQNSYRNTTTWAHPLSGTVDRIFSQDGAGNINVTTIGRGTAATSLQDRVNQERGPSIFEQQNQVCSAIVGGH
jgi:hypothetical protein